MQSRHFAHTTGLLAALLVLGCGGDNAEREDVYKVSGTITLAGAAVADAVVTFSPLDKQPVAFGRTNASGRYTLTTYRPGDGAAPGNYTVLVTKLAAPASTPAGGHDPHDPAGFRLPMHGANSGQQAEGGSLLPERYSRLDQSDLKANVRPDDENKFDFDLQPES